MAYGLRNLSDQEAGLKELHRILKAGGRAAVLDFNHLSKGSFSALFQKIYLRYIVVPIASILGLKKEYQYLEDSIKKFPSGVEQEYLAQKAGFTQACYQPIAYGQMGILILKA